MESLNVFYRVCPYNNGKSPIFADDKLGLVRFCLESFVEAFRATSLRITFILDSCDASYRTWIERHVPFQKEVLHFVGLGNEGSFFKQIELAAQLEPEESVYLAEDDYYYVAGAGEKLVAAISQFDFVTPYDHLQYYSRPPASEPCHITLCAGHHWRTHGSTCLTFGTKAGMVFKNRDIMYQHGVSDFLMWRQVLRKRRWRRKEYRLYGPIPSLATHLVSGLLAPGINWEDVWRKKLESCSPPLVHRGE